MINIILYILAATLFSLTLAVMVCLVAVPTILVLSLWHEYQDKGIL